ncbi:MAG: phage Gp37/Gp68 family protein [Gammaproteobacteria bacterium]|nr:phage Gp37/Gp68 family protein [Gammaproteobacteria bacterium]
MAAESSIEWTGHTWNPTTGCTKVSPGCKHCYAKTMADRLHVMGVPGYESAFRLTLHPERLSQPLHRKKPTTYFVNSMSDLFHKEVPDSFLDQVMGVIGKTPHHTYQILTKRADRLPVYFGKQDCPSNAWIGVSVENRRHGLPRIDHLRQVDAQIRFLSIEPLLESLGQINLDGISWVIVGGESGSKARPMQAEWLEEIRQQAESAGVAFFFKQWGAWGADGVKRSKKANGRIYKEKTWDEMPLAAV